MKVNEIFYSIEGEGRRAGMPCVFIRLFGCNLNCSYCDTRYSCSGEDYTEMSVEEILKRVKKFDCPNITVTGGEPLIHKDIDVLLEELSSRDYQVNVETNGSIVPASHNDNNIFYTVDYKTYSSGMTDRMNPKTFSTMSIFDVLKFVVGSREDLDQAYEFVKNNNIIADIYVSPIFGQIEPKEIVEYLKEHHLNFWKVQLQLHKYIWEPQKRGV